MIFFFFFQNSLRCSFFGYSYSYFCSSFTEGFLLLLLLDMSKLIFCLLCFSQDGVVWYLNIGEKLHHFCALSTIGTNKKNYNSKKTGFQRGNTALIFECAEIPFTRSHTPTWHQKHTHTHTNWQTWQTPQSRNTKVYLPQSTFTRKQHLKNDVWIKTFWVHGITTLGEPRWFLEKNENK